MIKPSLVLVAVALFVLGGNAMAQTNVASNTFAVSVSLTPVCNIKTQPGAADLNFGTYTPFTQTTITKTSSLVFQCSQGLAPSAVALATTAAAAEATVSAAGTSATAEGVLAGLHYTLGTNTIAAALTAGIAGTSAAVGSAGTGGTNSAAKEYNFTLTAVMAGGQSGATTGSTSHSYTMTVTY